jgi:hypothetical protein
VTTVFVALVVVAVLACPAHMLWSLRRGKSAGCLAGRHGAEDLAARQARLAQRVAQVRRVRG